MKSDRTAMHRRAQRAEADRDRAARSARDWETRWRYITGQRVERRERIAAEALSAFSARVSRRLAQGGVLVIAFAAFLTLTACATIPPPPPAVVVRCPSVKPYTAEFQTELAGAVSALPDGSPLVVAMVDYGQLRAAARACAVGGQR